MPTEDWVLKGTKLITNQKAKIKNLEVNSQKYNIKKTKQCHKNYYIYIYEVCFKIGFFFCKVIVGYKNEN